MVLVYDITTEASFLSLRNWMESVKDGVDDACVLCVVGNKVDMCTNESARAIKHDDAKRLAQVAPLPENLSPLDFLQNFSIDTSSFQLK